MNIRRANSGIRMASHRLVLREFVVTDEDAVHAFAADPLVTRFTDWGPNSVEDTRAFLGRGHRTGDQPTASRVQAILARRQPTTDWLSVKSGCCGCAQYWPRLTAMRP